MAYTPGYFHEATRGRSMECRPALIVTFVYFSSVLDEELHHVHIVIYTALQCYTIRHCITSYTHWSIDGN